MFTDIVGYTALTQNNESFAMQVLQKHNELLRPIFPKHHGKEIKTIGDAFLIEFESALEAVLCAVEIQESLHNYNKQSSSGDYKIKLRIGVHLGDVVYRENDVFGDAVNIASRIQPLAEPGGICVSEQVYDQLRNKLTYEMIKLEQVKLKNVLYPVDVFQIALPWEPVPRVLSRPPESEAIPLRRRLAILPLTNLAQDAQDEYFADGMTEELIAVLSNIKDLRVIARTSVMRYKGTTMRVSEIARELNVGSILEGSVRKTGNRVRVTVQAIDGGTEEHVFAASYDSELDDIFTVQSDIAKKVSRNLKAKLRAREKERITMKQTESIDAYNLYLKGRFVMHRRTKQAMEEAAAYFEHAIAKDNRYARAYAGLADSYFLRGSYGYHDTKEAYAKAKEFVSRALELDDNLAEAHVSLGFLLETYHYDFLGARKEYEIAISLNQSYAQARHWYAMNLLISDQFEEAATELEKAQEADPLSAQIAMCLGSVYLYLNRSEEALFEWDKAFKSDPENVPLLLNRGVYFARISRREEALADMKKALELSSGAVSVKCISAYVHVILGEREVAQKTLDEVSALSKTEYVSPYYLAILHATLDNREEFFASIGRAVEDRSAEIESLLHDPMFELFRSDPRFDGILGKIGVLKIGEGQGERGARAVR
jgi:TolB-like protein/tetratricopeptide (TPR) repeat protein